MHLTRPELGAALESGGIDPSGQRLPHILMYAETSCAICSGVPRDGLQTYALFDERVPPEVRFAGEEALLELARRYFGTHGPATVLDFRWWSNLRAPEAKRALEAAAGHLERVDSQGRTYWFAPAAMLPPARRSPGVRLLHVLDEYLIGYTDSRDLGFRGSPDLLSAFGSESHRHWIVDGGRIIGRWRLRRERGRFAISLLSFRPPSERVREGIARAATEFGRFYRMPVDISFTNPHTPG